MKLQKIAITGTPGSGKTTLAVQLSQLLGLPLHHLDRHLFLPDGIKRDKLTFRKIQEKLIKEPKWIIEGCGTTSLEVRYSKADLVFFLNLPRLLCLWRIFKRFLFERHKHPDTPEGCQKVFTFELIRYIWTFSKKKSPGIYALKTKYPKVSFFEIRSSKEVALFLNLLKQTKD